MKKLNLIKNVELFQGENYLKRDRTYFEGWYFKLFGKKSSIAFIPGIQLNSKERYSFIQVITDNGSYIIHYSIDDFIFNNNPFYIKIKDNYFSKDYIHINIKDNDKKLKIVGNVSFSNHIDIHTNFFSPNIMGPFSYIPFMECNHGILSMKNETLGTIYFHKNKLNFNSGTGYIEKDWGVSFPKSYIWCQGNNFKNKNASFMCSIANIDLKIFDFTGLISLLIIDGKEYRFTTYNGSKVIKCAINDNNIHVVLKRNRYILDINSNNGEGYNLLAPVKGSLEKNIIESITSIIKVTLKKDNNVIFEDKSNNCGLEIVS